MTTHLVKHQKMTKRQIKEDPLVTAAFRGAAIWETHGTRILIGLGAVALAGLLAFFVARTRAEAEERAGADLYRATIAYQQGDPATAIPTYREVVDNAPGTRAATRAMMFLGDCYAMQGKPADAVVWYRRYLQKVGRDREARAAGQLGLAGALEDNGDFAESATLYAQVARDAADDNDRARYLMGQGRVLLRSGQIPKALEVYRAVLALPDADIAFKEAARGRLSEFASTPAP